MRARNIKKQFWINKEEDLLLKKNCKKVGLSEADLLRTLISGFVPKEKPPQEFYNSIRELRSIGNNLNQIAKRANALGIINYSYYKEQSDMLNQAILDIKRKYLYMEKKDE